MIVECAYFCRFTSLPFSCYHYEEKMSSKFPNVGICRKISVTQNSRKRAHVWPNNVFVHDVKERESQLY